MSVLRLIGATIDWERGSVVRRGREVALTPLELRLLRCLWSSEGVVSRARLLEQVWGYRPGVHSRTLDTTMRRLRQKVELLPDRPHHLLTVHGEGYRFAPPPSLCPPAELWGREAESAALSAALERSRLVTLLGRAGQGRRSLARAVAARWGPSSEVEETEGADALEEALNEALARALGTGRAGRGGSGEHLLVVRAQGPEALERLRSWLLGRLRGGQRALVVAEAPLSLPGEQIVVLTGLDLSGAVALLRARLGPRVSEEQAQRLVQEWDGWPLALLQEADRMRGGGPLGVAAVAVEQALQGSWRGLSEADRARLARLAVGEAWDPGDELVARAWLCRGAGAPRLPPALARWVRAQPQGRAAALARAEAVVSQIQADPEGAWDEVALEVATGDGPPELRASAALALAERELSSGSASQARAWIELAGRLTASPALTRRASLLLGRLSTQLGAYGLARETFERLLADPEAEPTLRAEARLELAYTAISEGRAEDAAPLLLETPTTAYPRLLHARARAALAQAQGAPESCARWREVIAEAERQGRKRLVARWAPNLAVTLRATNRDAEADRVLRQAIDAQAEVGDRRNIGFTRLMLAQSLYDAGELAGASGLLDQVEEVLDRRHQRRDWQHLLLLRAGLALEAGDPYAALSYAEDALIEGQYVFTLPAAQGFIGCARWLAGDLAAAERLMHEAHERLMAHPSPERLRLVTLARLLAVRAERGDCAPAREWPPGGQTDRVAAAVDVERLHLALHEGGLPALKRGWCALRAPRSGPDRLSRLLLRARLRREGLQDQEWL